MVVKNKAFTLVEILAVIIVLGIILALAVPRVISIIDKYKEKAYEIQKKNIVTAAKEYSLLHSGEIEWKNNIAYIRLGDLQAKGLLPSDVKNPKGGTFDPEEIVLTLVKDDNGLIKYYEGEYILSLASIIQNDIDTEEKNIGSSNQAWFYVGADPNNWLEFGTIDGVTILWRIIKSNNEGIKIIYEGKRKQDNTNPIDNGRITVDGNNVFAWDTSNSNKWERPADFKAVLHNWYNNTLVINNRSKYIAPIKWCIGAIPYNNPTLLVTFLDNECANNYNGYPDKTDEAIGVGLIRPSDYISTSNAETCVGSYWTGEGSVEFNNQGRDCGKKLDGTVTNFLYKSAYTWWTLNARASSASIVWRVDSTGDLFGYYASYAVGGRPVLNLKSDILHSEGTGTLTNPYTIK
ncbi:MAG: prepilin-type N-terminal cleavage/methylation domain-containing protein [Bacilli bacterium]